MRCACASFAHALESHQLPARLWSRQRLGERRFDQRGDVGAEPCEVLHIPGVERPGARFNGAVSEYRVIDRATSNSCGCRGFESMPIFALVEGHNRQALAHIADK